MMYPPSQYMDPYYSHYRIHSPYSYYPPPGWEAGHPRTMDSSYRPPSCGPWPYNNGCMPHPHPPEFHCCCNHSYPSGYYGFRSPFPEELPPAYLYYHGPFPQPPYEYPSYFARPHPYPVEQTPYDYNKFKSHCCGCPNHVCHGGEKSNVKIEEERPDGKPERELKDADNSSMIRYPNNEYPVIWLPSGDIEDKEKGKRYELPPHLLNGWVPVGGKRAEDAKQQGQDDRPEKQYQWPIVWVPAGYDEPKQKDKELKGKDENPKIAEETPPSPKIKIIPLSWFEDQKLGAKSGSKDHNDRSAVESQPATTEHGDGAATEGHHKATPVVPRRANDERKPPRENYKTIPVLPEKETDEKKLGTYRTIPVTTQKENAQKKPAVTEKKEEKKDSNAERPGENGKGNHSESPTAKKLGTYRTIPVMTQKENDEKNPAVTEKKEEKKVSNAETPRENGKGNHSESPTTKHSKLPPVCLRVDPLPRKKSGNGSSRSPSPPARKDADKAKKEMNETQSQNLEPKQPDTTVSEMKEKPPEELNKGTGFSNETVVRDSARHSQEEEVPTSNDHQKVRAGSTSVHVQENAGADTEGDGTQENAGAETLKGGDRERDSETFRARLSEADAVTRIQSAYRGYDVRRWQPLDKLRKIRDVHEQMPGVRKQLQCLEASSKKPTEKEQEAIGEAIMNLLLKLDTIQGLHPCVREARKSVARELICLQEKLDSLCKQLSGRFNHSNEDEKLERAESITNNTAPSLTAEASDKEVKAVGLSEANQTSPVNSMELSDAVPSEVNMEVGQDIDGLKNENEKSCASTMEVPREEEKAVGLTEANQTSPVNSIELGDAVPSEVNMEMGQDIDVLKNQNEKSCTRTMEVPRESRGQIVVGLTEASQTYPLNSMELGDAVPSEVNMEVGQDIDVLKNQNEKSCTSTMEIPRDEGNAVEQVKFQGASSTHMMSAKALPEQPHHNHELQIEESNAISLQATGEEKKVAIEDEAQDMPPMNFIGPLHNAAPTVISSGQEKCMASTWQSLHGEESNTGVSPAVTRGIKATTTTESFDNGLPADNDVSAEDLTREADGVERTDPRHDVSFAEETPDIILEDPLVSLNDAEPPKQDPATAADWVISNEDEQPKEPSSNVNMEELVADDTLDSTKEPDGKQEASMGPTSEEPSQAALLEPTSEFDSVSEQTVLEELNNAMQNELSGKDDVPHVDEKNEVLELMGEEFDVQENHSIAEGIDSRAETVLQELDSSESSAGCERPEVMVSFKSQTAAQAPNTDERTETLEEAPAGVMGSNSVEEVDVHEPRTEGCNGTLDVSTICTTGVTPAEVGSDNPKEDVGAQTESKASVEALSAPVSTDSGKDSAEKKLVEENKKLKELLQKLLTSGNDQTEVIADLNEKLKVLERKLARKKKPKVRVHRSARHATAKVH